MSAAAALSYLLAGFAGVIVIIYFVLGSIGALRLLVASARRDAPGSIGRQLAGIGLVFPALVFLSLLAADGLPWAGGLIGAGSILVAVGLAEAATSLAARWRWAAQICAVLVAVWYAQSALADDQWHWALALCIAGGVLWYMRLYTRMNRIDGICAVQCLLFCVAVQVLTLGVPGWVGDLIWLLAGSALGFLVYGWPPARVPLGRISATFVGLLLALIAVYLWRRGLLPLVASLILLAGFWFDACYTGCVRILRGHRGGALIDRLVAGKGLVWTNIAYLLFSVCWLLPLAWLAARYARFELLCLLVAILPMGVAAERLNAGAPVSDEG